MKPVHFTSSFFTSHDSSTDLDYSYLETDVDTHLHLPQIQLAQPLTTWPLMIFSKLAGVIHIMTLASNDERQQHGKTLLFISSTSFDSRTPSGGEDESWIEPQVCATLVVRLSSLVVTSPTVTADFVAAFPLVLLPGFTALRRRSQSSRLSRHCTVPGHDLVLYYTAQQEKYTLKASHWLMCLESTCSI